MKTARGLCSLICGFIVMHGTGASYGQTLQAPPLLLLEAKIPLGEVRGRIDHMAIDPKRNRLVVAELGNNSARLIDLNTVRPVQVIGYLKEPQGVAYVPSTDMFYISNAADGSLRLFRGDDLAPAGQIDLGEDADNIRVDPATR